MRVKKPILLLIDDDRAVLEALEAELAPEFAQLCRIEAFDDPRGVLDALTAWSLAGRSVALAIVDQKMPGMSGAELLAELRCPAVPSEGGAFQPCRHVRTLMLTGYAGVDSAIAAKNTGGVARYVEKPWRRDELIRMVRGALAEYANAAGAGLYFEFRELESDSELLDSLRLRYQVYAREPALSRLLPPGCPEPMDADAHDRFSRHFGLFECDGDEEAMRGSIRCAQDGEGRLSRGLEQRLPSGTPLGDRIREPRDGTLPLLHYVVHRAAVEKLMESIARAGEVVVEPSRLVLLPAHRAGGERGDRALARQMIESLVGYFFFFQIGNALLTCAPPHTVFYRPYGFVEAEGTEIVFTPTFGAPWATLHGHSARVSPSARERCEEIVQRLARNAGGGACRCENFPACLGGPYATGDFSATDLWCPALARRLLKGNGDTGS